MDSITLRHLATRAATSAHNGLIRNAGEDEKMWDPTIDQVFSHQPACYNAATILENNKDSRKVTNEMLAAHFYTACYCNVRLRKGDEQGQKVLEASFIDNVILGHSRGVRNNLSYLLGQVGVGKSAFLNSLISKYGKHWVDDKGIWFLRVDAEVAGKGKLLTPALLIDILAKKMLKILSKHPTLMHPSARRTSEHAKSAYERLNAATIGLRITPPDSYNEQATKQLEAFVNVIQAMLEHCEKRICIIIDNLDYLVHLADPVLYHSREEDESAIEATCDLVRMFMHDGHPLRSIGANVLFVMRMDTFVVLSEYHGTSLFDDSNAFARNAYVLEKPQWQMVLRSRGVLLDYVASHEGDKPRGNIYRSLVKLLEDTLLENAAESSPMIIHLEQLANHGLREIIHFFADYSWVGQKYYGNGLTVMERMSRHRHLALTAYMLRGKRRFSQWTCRFPNIYLVNDSRSGDPHSYWLKRLIIEFLLKQKETDQQISPEHVITVFKASDGRGYNESLIKDCLGSLSDANASNVINVHRRRIATNKIDIATISLTERGSHCISSLCDTFTYLQLCVEDPALRFPRALLPDFDFNRHNADYGYLMEVNVEAFQAGAKGMIQQKAQQVILFLDILRISLEIEKEAFSSAFQELKFYGVNVPDMYKMRDNVINELKAITNDTGILNLEQVLAFADKRRPDIENALEDVYPPWIAL